MNDNAAKKICVSLNSHKVMIEEIDFKKLWESKYNIALPADLSRSYQSGACEGRLIKTSLDAFDYLPEEERPKIGQMLYFKKYDGEGYEFNGKYYRFILDKLIHMWSDELADRLKDEIC